MSWTTPRTWVATEMVTAAIMNAHVRDNLSYLQQAKITRVTKGTTQSITSGVVTALTFDTETADTLGMHDNVTNPSRLTVPTGWAGTWLVGGFFAFVANATGDRQAIIWKNGIAVDRATHALGSASVAPNANPFVPIQAAVGDYFELAAYQVSGGALSTNGTGDTFVAFWATWLSA